jgi:hypothetical protein
MMAARASATSAAARRTACFLQRLAGTLYLGLQKVSGDTNWMSVYGSSGRTLGNDMFNGNFSNADERSWQARYDYNFAAMGVPGLLAMVRYGHGDNATTKPAATARNGSAIPNRTTPSRAAALKNLSIRLNNRPTGAASTATLTRPGDCQLPAVDVNAAT